MLDFNPYANGLRSAAEAEKIAMVVRMLKISSTFFMVYFVVFVSD